MQSIAFFNNKGGVGKTSLVYHLAWMFAELNYRVVAADLDPQANLSGMFLDEDKLDVIWRNTKPKTIDKDIAPLFEGTGDVSARPHIEKITDRTGDVSARPHIEKITGRIGLLMGDLALSKREDELSGQWPKCMDGDKRAFRVTTAFARIIASAGKEFEADLVLIDVGPNLGAINRTALIASDYVVIPLAPDLFSLQGLRNVGPTLKTWRKAWQKRVDTKPDDLHFDLPEGEMEPLGYIVMRHSIRLNRPVQAYYRWIDKIPAVYKESVKGESAGSTNRSIDNDPSLLAHLKDYRSLMPLAQEANKPMFMLKPADGVIGAQQNAVRSCYQDFKALAREIMARIDPDNQ